MLQEEELREILVRVFRDNESVPTYKKYLVPEMRALLPTLPLKSWVYSRLKKEELAGKEGTRVKVYSTSRPPDVVMALPLREQLIWEWRWSEALRIQKRLSFWKDTVEADEAMLFKIAEIEDFKFAREVIIQKVYNDRRNKNRKAKAFVEIEADTGMHGMVSFKFFWSTIGRYLTDMKNKLTVNTGSYYRLTLDRGGRRTPIHVFAVDLKHACALVAVKWGRSCFVIRVDELDGPSKRKSFEIRLDGRSVSIFKTAKGGVIVQEDSC